VITDRFVASVRALAATHGLPEYPFVVVAHPIADNDDAALREKAEQALSRVVSLLTERPAVR
jgi:hypothetical protein